MNQEIAESVAIAKIASTSGEAGALPVGVQSVSVMPKPSIGEGWFQLPPPEPDSWGRHPGRTLILHLHHPMLGDKPLKPVIQEALAEYLRRLELDEVGGHQTESMELPSGARLDTVVFGPGV